MSTAHEIPPAARPSTSDPPNGPIPLFDAQLRLLNDSYLSFFQERKRIEDVYLDSLRKLHAKAQQVDGYLNDRMEPSTSRIVWNEVRDNVATDIQCREAYVASLTSDVIGPLSVLKDTQERIRKRIRDDLKDAIVAHTEYVETVYPKLKRNYLKKSQDVEDYKAAAAAERAPLSPTLSADGHVGSPRIGMGRPVVTSPQPLRPLERRASGSAATTRNRSPSSSTTFHELAHQGKKQFNQLMTTFLEKGAKDSGRSDNALRTVRAKREADEADKEYRKGVIGLKPFGFGGRRSWKVVITATATSQKQMCERIAMFVDGINPERDAKSVSMHIPQLLAAASPKPQYYYNYSVGECRDLIFGVSLVDYATSRGLQDGEIPKIVKLCLKEIEERGMDAEGIYRVSGRHAAVQELQHKIERNEAAFQFHAPQDDVYAVASLLKLYLRELPEPVFKFSLQERIQHTGDLDEHISNDFQLLRSKIRRLPPVHQATLKAIVEHLARVAAKSEKNKMDSRNLAIVFGSVIFGEDNLPKDGDLMSVQSWKDTLMEDLITHSYILFQSNQSPPLPLAPLGEAPAVVTYGSQSTKVIQVPPPLPPRSPSPRKQPEFIVPPLPPRIIQQQSQQLSTSPEDTTPQLPSLPQRPPNSTHSSIRHSSNSSDDFAPQLPPRPTNSIHPSLRSGPMSANPARQSLPPSLRPFMEEHIPFASSSTPVPPSVQPATPVSPSSQSVPPSPSRTLPRRTPTALPLPSPWSDRDGLPSESSSAAPTLASAGQSLTSDQSDSPPATPAPAPEEDLDFEPIVSGPSSSSTYESAKSDVLTQSDTVQPSSPPLPPKSKSRPPSSKSTSTTITSTTNNDPPNVLDATIRLLLTMRHRLPVQPALGLLKSVPLAPPMQLRLVLILLLQM
ncbi:hypothetical protein QCA50_001430 [Cerrena zonata]|uniref:Rho-GAP domain-containing protein n=1 Tax=Cerrena zonata TaxID=2478898 RepID=A0AAW0GT82_9APHY